MGKQEVPLKQNERSATKSTNVFKQGSNRKAVRTVSYKRVLMLQRRINTLINERNAWEEKNKELTDALNAEKLLTASLKKESFHYQRLYHESAITINSYKMKQFETTQSLSKCLRVIDATYPHMVAFTDSVTSAKIHITNLLNSLPSTDYSCLTKQFNEGGGINNENRKTEKPMKHKVGPMVKGLQIVTKPKIMIERLMLPQTQDQIINDDNVDDISPINDNPLPPIPEEDEDPCFRHVPVRLKRSKLGTSWRQRRQETLKKDVSRERDRNTSVSVAFNEDSSDDSDDIPTVMQPRFKDIGRRIKGSSLTKVESTCGGEKDVVSHQSAPCHFPLRSDDPLEGSSRMYRNYYHPSHAEGLQSSIYKSDSSDDEDALIVQNNAPDLSTMNTLIMKNHSFENSMINKIESKSKSSNRNTSSDCTPEVPDSTNNVGSLINNNLSTKGSKSPCSPSSTSSPGISTDYGTTNNTLEQQLSKSHNRLSVCLSKVPSSTPRLSINCSNRCSDLRNSPEESFVTTRKRTRQPNTQRYPSEDFYVYDITKINNSKTTKSASGKQSLPKQKKNKDVRYQKKRLSSKPSMNNEIDNGVDNKDGTEGSSSKMKRSKSKTRLSKKSIFTPKPSINNGLQQSQDSGSEDRPSRRNKSNVCYKESPLNSKKRRP